MISLSPKSSRSARGPANDRSRASTPPMRTMDLTGFYCRKGDRDYAAAAKATGTTDGTDIYWFREVGDRMVWDKPSQRRSLGLAQAVEQDRLLSSKHGLKQNMATVEEYYSFKKDSAIKQSSALKEDAAIKKNTAAKKVSFVDHVSVVQEQYAAKKDPAVEQESEKVAGNKGKGKRPRDEDASTDPLSESKPITDFSKVKIDEIEDIGVAMPQETPALVQALASSATAPNDPGGLIPPKKKKSSKCATQ